MGKPIGKVNGYPFNINGIRVCAASDDSGAVTGEKSIYKQASNNRFKMKTTEGSANQIDSVTFNGTSTSAGVISFLFDGISFDVAVTIADTAGVIALAVETSAIALGIEVEVSADTISFTHAEASIQPEIDILIQVSDVTSSTVVTPNVPGTTSKITIDSELGKNRDLLRLHSSDLTVASSDAELATELVAIDSGLSAVRVFDRTGTVIGFAHSFALNKVVVEIAGAGAKTDGTFVVGVSHIVDIDSAGMPIIPTELNPNIKYLIEGYSLGFIDNI